MPTTLHRLCAPLLGLALLAGCQQGQGENFFGGLLDSVTPPTPGEAARDAFNPYDADKRRRALAMLSAAPFGGEAPYLRAYRLLLNDRDATVRATAVKALGDHGAPEDGPAIVERLGDADPFVRWQAARALQKIHYPPAAEPLIEVLREDADADARMAAAYALGQYRAPGVYDSLAQALDDPSFGVVHNAHAALRTLTGQDLPRDPEPWLAWGRDHRQTLFAAGQSYGYLPYVQPPGFFARAFLRKDTPAPEPTPPTGTTNTPTSTTPDPS